MMNKNNSLSLVDNIMYVVAVWIGALLYKSTGNLQIIAFMTIIMVVLIIVKTMARKDLAENNG